MGTFSVYQPAPPSQQNQQPVPSGVYNPSPGSGDLYQQRARAAFGIPGNPNYPGMFGGNTGVTVGMLGPVSSVPPIDFQPQGPSSPLGWSGQYGDPSPIPSSPGTDFGMKPGIPGPGEDPFGNRIPQYGDPGFDPQNPPPFWRPKVDAGGYIPTDQQRQGEDQWYRQNLPGYGTGGGRMTLGDFFSGTIGGGRNTLSAGAGPFQSTAVARSARPMMPMRGLFGSAMGGAAQMPSQIARVMMRAPDGTVQSVDPAHVDHYTGLGAQVVNGSSYGGGGY